MVKGRRFFLAYLLGRLLSSDRPLESFKEGDADADK